MLALQLVLLVAPAIGSPAPPPQTAPNTRSPHGALNIPCQNCHTFSGWKPIRSMPEFDHSKTRYPLRGMHKNVACVECHSNAVFTNVGNKCADCHADIHRRQMGAQCEQCHSVNGWTVSLKSISEHQNRFPLIGAHAVTDCESCHKGAAVGQFKGLSTDCVSCHMTTFTNTKSPSHVALNFSTNCQQCHRSMDSWAGATFNHLAFTGFALTGAHATLDCSVCHVGGRYQGTPSNCTGCHLKDYNGAKDPNHAQIGFPQTCSQCHSTATWLGATFNHAITGFALTGAHASLSCSSCHTGGTLTAANTTCVSCHLTDFQKTTNPNHALIGFPTDCLSCHSTTNWQGAKFDHSTTGFALTGAHASLNCSSCHTGGTLTAASTNCVSCHLKDFQGTTNPNHVAGGFAQQCNLCHTTTAWQPATFDHSKSGFSLTGAHATVACAQCHVNGNYNLTSAACATCHLTDFQKTTNPNHASVGFPTDCSVCHNTTNWLGATFNHSTTGFPLTGAHASLTCSSCHTGGSLSAANTNCVSCHLKDFQGATNPNHVALAFPQQCNTCHTTTAWQPATFNHATTGFPLTGAHATATCTQCHTNGNYNITSAACATCHLKDYQSTTNPNHTAVAFPQTCEQCHSTTNWLGATFNHATTGFALTGTHATLACSSCHGGTPLAAANAACASCHLKDYQATTNPSHVAVSFPTDCSQCHSTTNWSGATFNHATTGFALTGTHATQACSVCHAGTPLTAANAACASCHLKNYQGTTNPNHAAVGFPTDCSLCHSTTNWSGATFNHATTGFTLTGAHATLNCSACHGSTPLSAANTTCVSCHLKDYNGTTSPNHVTLAFPQTCEICHTTTVWQPATFDHSKTVFPLTGAHTSVACALCHIGGNYTTTPTDCYSCHKADYTGVTNPNHIAAGFPTTCQTCHTTTSWAGATFNHTWFPIPHHSAKLCSDCHTNPSDYTVFVCTSCHTQGPTTSEHSGVKGFVWNSANCYACHKNGGGG
ncbi:MAG: hypothetical protein LAN64_11050 [Acidobacteriia bacterium]|nr:hypothetical protein [Terriglobia bacterium]